MSGTRCYHRAPLIPPLRYSGSPAADGSWRRLALGVAAAATCQAIHVASLPTDGVRPSWGFFGAHLAVLLAFHVTLALALGAWRDGRIWSSAAFVVPMALSLTSGRLLHSLPQAWVESGAGLAAVLVVGAGALGAWPRQAWPSAALGAVLSAEVLRFRIDAFSGASTPLADCARPLAVAVATVAALAWLQHHPSHGWRGIRPALIGGSAALALAVGLMAPGRWGAGLSAPEGPVRAPGPAVVLIVLDTVRADHLQSYGYARDTMPRLESFTRSSCVRAARSVAVHPSSLESHASFFTGLYPAGHGAHRRSMQDRGSRDVHAYPLSAEHETLAELLGRAGYWTVALSANYGQLAPEFGLDQGFDVYRAAPDEFRRRTPWHQPFERLGPAASARVDRLLPAAWGRFTTRKPYREAATITDEAIAVLDSAAERPLFLFVNYLDAHAPNAAPGPFLDAFEGRDHGSDVDGSIEATRSFYGKGREPGMPVRRHLEALYDGELSYLDAELGRLLERLKQHPRWGETMVIVTADHGESLGERGILGHGHSLYTEQLSVPFFLKPGRVAVPGAVPGVLPPERVVQSVDVFPLVLEQARVTAPVPNDGLPLSAPRPVVRSWAYRAGEHARLDPARFDRELRSVEVDGLMLISSNKGGVELFDVRRDPAQTQDQHRERPADTERLLALLGPASGVPESPATSPPDEALKERLRALGYVQ